MKFVGLNGKRGQNTAEYLILLVLVSVGTIGVFSAFGKSLKRQIGSVMAQIEGNEEKSPEKVTGQSEFDALMKDAPAMDITKKKLQYVGSDSE